jgi:hypothetical protein
MQSKMKDVRKATVDFLNAYDADKPNVDDALNKLNFLIDKVEALEVTP